MSMPLPLARPTLPLSAPLTAVSMGARAQSAASLLKASRAGRRILVRAQQELGGGEARRHHRGSSTRC
jgi:hypothetical protein